jgi:sugar phosphate isomerase/epimerase
MLAGMTDIAPAPIAPAKLGLNVPYEWWPASPLLKEIEASGFGWVQIPPPPGSVLVDTRATIKHAAAVRRSLETTSLRAVLHAPGALAAGEPGAGRAFEAVLSYAAEAGCEQVVYHAMATTEHPGVGARLEAEAEVLAHMAALAERLDIVIAIENLAPVYPGPERLSAMPTTLRRLVAEIGSPGLRLCLDVGHANVIAGLRRTDLRRLIDPVLDSVSLFHLHDNLGARGGDDDERAELDPLRLDLHLPPGRGTLPFAEIGERILEHDAPILLEIHPPHRPAPAELAVMTAAALQGRRAPAGAPA